jgi:hypothetical protein
MGLSNGYYVAVPAGPAQRTCRRRRHALGENAEEIAGKMEDINPADQPLPCRTSAPGWHSPAADRSNSSYIPTITPSIGLMLTKVCPTIGGNCAVVFARSLSGQHGI